MAMLPAQAPPAREPVHQIWSRRAGALGRGLAGRSDERLVQIACDGDERAFAVLYERHSAAILRYSRSLLRSGQEAEDVKQEVFVLAITALRRGPQPATFRPWLYRVAHNACVSHLRARRPVLVADDDELAGWFAAAEPAGDHREELRQLLDDIGHLPDVQRGALLLREMDGFSYEQVGEALGLPESTVRATIFRARRTLHGLAEARDADCEAIRSELSRLADRRGRRSREITSHLRVCASCREFRDGLRRRRPRALSGASPAHSVAPVGALVALKGKLLGGAAAGGPGAAASTAGGAGILKLAAVAASTCAVVTGAGIGAERAFDPGHGSQALAATRSAPPRSGTVTVSSRARLTGSRTAAAGGAPGAVRPKGPAIDAGRQAAHQAPAGLQAPGAATVAGLAPALGASSGALPGAPEDRPAGDDSDRAGSGFSSEDHERDHPARGVAGTRDKQNGSASADDDEDDDSELSADDVDTTADSPPGDDSDPDPSTDAGPADSDGSDGRSGASPPGLQTSRSSSATESDTTSDPPAPPAVPTVPTGDDTPVPATPPPVDSGLPATSVAPPPGDVSSPSAGAVVTAP
jgi:RNA polymerase sigma factor (sigma-70 family)